MSSFGLVAVVVLDADSRFRGAFEAMCKFLKITFWHILSGNHEVDSFKKYHRFLDKTQAIARKYSSSHDIFIINAKTSHYACSRALIDDTNKMCIVADFGREFRFPLDMELLQTPTLNIDNNQALFKHL